MNKLDTTVNLSPNARKLLAFLLETKGAHEGTCAEHLFDKPQYPGRLGTPEQHRAFWQWEANMHGIERSIEISGVTERFCGPVDRHQTYEWQTSAAYQELRAAGLAREINNGTNSYCFLPTIGRRNREAVSR